MFVGFQAFNAHNRSEVTSIQFLASNKLASISHDSTLKIWDLSHFSARTPNSKMQPQSKLSFNSSYLTSLLIHQNTIIIGDGNGHLTFLDKSNLQTIKKLKIHHDAINQIILDANNFITVGSDGKVNFIDSKTHKVIHTLDVGSPIHNVVRYQESIFLSGVRSYSVGEDGVVKKGSDVLRYIVHQGRLYGTSDQKGFACISRKFNSYVPCENMVSLPDGILGSSWSTLSFFTIYQNDERISYSSTKIPQISAGDSMLCLKACPQSSNRMFCSSQSGNIYTFTMNFSYRYLQQ